MNVEEVVENYLKKDLTTSNWIWSQTLDNRKTFEEKKVFLAVFLDIAQA